MSGTYSYKGYNFTMQELATLSLAYKLMCTQELLEENYDFSEPESIQAAGKIRFLMDKHDLSETEAINEYLERRRTI